MTFPFPDLLFTCKVSGMRSLQYCCLLIPPNKRGLLQVLLKFMVRLAENHIIFLSDDLPIKEMVRFALLTPLFMGDMLYVYVHYNVHLSLRFSNCIIQVPMKKQSDDQ